MQFESPPSVGSRYLISQDKEYEYQQIFAVGGLVQIFKIRGVGVVLFDLCVFSVKTSSDYTSDWSGQ